jgi:hypothetical protein
LRKRGLEMWANRASILFGDDRRQLTIELELFRTRGIRLFN